MGKRSRETSDAEEEEDDDDDKEESDDDELKEYNLVLQKSVSKGTIYNYERRLKKMRIGIASELGVESEKNDIIIYYFFCCAFCLWNRRGIAVYQSKV